MQINFLEVKNYENFIFHRCSSSCSDDIASNHAEYAAAGRFSTDPSAVSLKIVKFKKIFKYLLDL